MDHRSPTLHSARGPLPYIHPATMLSSSHSPCCVTPLLHGLLCSMPSFPYMVSPHFPCMLSPTPFIVWAPPHPLLLPYGLPMLSPPHGLPCMPPHFCTGLFCAPGPCGLPCTSLPPLPLCGLPCTNLAFVTSAFRRHTSSPAS